MQTVKINYFNLLSKTNFELFLTFDRLKKCTLNYFFIKGTFTPLFENFHLFTL